MQLDLTDESFTFSVKLDSGEFDVDIIKTYWSLKDSGALDGDDKWAGSESEIAERFRVAAKLPESVTGGQLVRIRGYWMERVQEAEKKIVGGQTSPPPTELARSNGTTEPHSVCTST